MNLASPVVWHRATLSHLEAIDRIAKEIHPSLPEGREVYEEKLRLFPDGCFILRFGESICGYCVSFPWTINSAPELGRVVSALPESPSCIYIHDVAVLEQARGHGAAGELIEQLTRLAKKLGIDVLSLVSVYGTYPFWYRFGFEIVPGEPLGDKLAGYGNSARYMVCRLS
jgi:GNAT superfamily N-acetyltransferase